MSKIDHPEFRKAKNDGKLWERLENETEKQFLAFKQYRDLSPIDRSTLEAYRRHTGRTEVFVASSWFYELSTKNRWKERAAAFDQYLDRLQWEAETDERLKARKLRRAVLITAQKRLGEALVSFDFGKATAGDVARLLDVIARNLREEYSDQPEHRAKVTLVNGGSSELVQLADAASTMTDSDIVSEYRRLTGTPSKAIGNDSEDSGHDEESN
jgi:hypothetical protein